MSQNIIASNDQNIILTTGIYDLVKEHIRLKKVTPMQGEILTHQLKNAKQVTRKNLPANVVTIDASITIKDHSTNKDQTLVFVAPDKAKKKNNTESILSPIGLALVGCKEGDLVKWVFEDGEKQLEILKVERLS